MLTDDAKLVLNFIEECRTQGNIKDELFYKLEEMYSALYQIQDFLIKDKEKMRTFIKLEDAIVMALDLTKDIYFEYGDNFAQVREKDFFMSIGKGGNNEAE